jgi:hypothetical protein
MPNNNNTRRQKRTAELFQNVLGLTGETGYANAFRVGKQLSKQSAANYLTTTRRRLNQPIIRRKQQISRLLPGYNGTRHGSRLHYAIQLANPEAMAMLLAENQNINERNRRGYTLLEALVKNYFDFDWASNDRERKRRAAQNLLAFLPTLLARNPTITLSAVEMIWKLSRTTGILERFLRFPPLAQFSIAHFEVIEEELQEVIGDVQDEIDNDEPNLGLLNKLARFEERLRQLHRLVATYNPETGEFDLMPPPIQMPQFAPVAFAAPPPLPAGNLIAQLQALGAWNPNA